jgi:hypothetical protein
MSHPDRPHLSLFLKYKKGELYNKETNENYRNMERKWKCKKQMKRKSGKIKD